MVPASEPAESSETTEPTEEVVEVPVVSRTTTIEIAPVEERVSEENGAARARDRARPLTGYRLDTVSSERAACAITPATSLG